jgi:hypothetical protein
LHLPCVSSCFKWLIIPLMHLLVAPKKGHTSLFFHVYLPFLYMTCLSQMREVLEHDFLWFLLMVQLFEVVYMLQLWSFPPAPFFFSLVSLGVLFYKVWKGFTICYLHITPVWVTFWPTHFWVFFNLMNAT